MTSASAAAPAEPAKTPKISFDRDIRPILSENCFTCHGPDEKARKAGLRLDLHDEALKAAKSGAHAIVPGNLETSELLRRINTTDEDDLMPRPKSGKKLTQAQKDLLRAWIANGAPWNTHWAFVPPRNVPPPEVKDASWPKNEIDRFVLARLERENLAPSPEADKTTLLRRVTIDLTGLPPTLAEVDAFLADSSPDAYEKVVDRLLNSPRYGENMARYWLDAARYADSHGFHIDSERGLWKYRDWVIGAFNENMPFDAFTTDQLAGDLLPKATIDDKIASGFLRCNMTSGEGGAIDEEYKAKYTFDRVETTSTIWLGLTMTCCRCHSHKFDPIQQKEYYGLYSIFNNLDESIMDGNRPNPEPFLSLPSPEQTQRIESLKKQIEEGQAKMDGPMAGVDSNQEEWAARWHDWLAEGWQSLTPAHLLSTGDASMNLGEGSTVFFESFSTNEESFEFSARVEPGTVAALRLAAMPAPGPANDDGTEAEQGRVDLASFKAELIVTGEDGRKGEPKSLSFSRAVTDRNEEELDKVLKKDAAAAWKIAPLAKGRPQTALFVLNDALKVGSNTEIRIKLRCRVAKPGRTVGSIVVSAARSPELAALLAPPKEAPWRMVGPFKAEETLAALAMEYPPETETDFDKKYPGVRGDIKWEKKNNFVDGESHQVVDGLQGTHGVHYFRRTLVESSPQKVPVTLRIDDVGKVWLNGRVVFEQKKKRLLEEGPARFSLDLQQGTNIILVKQVTFQGDSNFAFDQYRNDPDRIPPAVAAALCVAKNPEGREKATLQKFYRRESSAPYRELVDEVAQWRRDKAAVERAIPTTMIARDADKPRDTFILVRGEYDKKGDKVSPGVPSILPPWPKDQPTNRFGLAKWLLDPAHPLTARVNVNRFWQQYFGVGLVKTTEDFGLQGEPPSHPELLDWLAFHFASGWDVKGLQRLIVTSATYRQSSKETAALIARDPENRLLARGARFRADAEIVRDTALYAGGLLVERLGGHSVKPWQPSGLWETVSYNNSQKYVPDTGDGEYRRSLYTYWKRQSPPPNMLVLDASTRESCVVRRPRTNTPLQALVLLNDPQFVEASRAMAARIMTEAPDDPEKRAAFAFRLATSRAPRADELKVLVGLYQRQLEIFTKDRGAAEKLLSVGAFQCAGTLDRSELAAWAAVASVILNLDETLTKG